MNFFAVSSAITAANSFTAGGLVFFANKKNKKNLTFSINTLSVGFWALSFMLWQMATDAGPALFYCRLLMIAVAFIPSTHYHYILTLCDAATPSRKKFLLALYVLSAIFVVFGFSPLYVSHVEPRSIFPFWPVPGPLGTLYFLITPIPLLMSGRLIVEQKRKVSPLVQNKLKWLIFAMIFGYGGAWTTIPLWYDIHLIPYAIILSAIYCPVAASLYFRLAIIDFNEFIRGSINFLVSGTVTVVALAGFLAPLHKSRHLTPTLLLAGFVAPLIFQFVKPWVERWTSVRYLGKLTRTLEKIRETTYTYDDLARNIVKSALDTFPIEMAAVYFYDLHQKSFFLRAQNGMRNPLTRDLRFNRSALAVPETDPLITTAAHDQTILHLNALQDKEDFSDSDRLVISSMARIEAEICAPLLFEKAIKGLLVLGRKKDNTMFSFEDFRAIQAFSQMGQEIMRYIMAMETELRHSSMTSHDIDNDLRSLIQTLEFVLSPVVKQQAEERVKSLLQKAKSVAQHAQHVFQTNRDRSNLIMKSVRGEYDLVPVDITKALRSSFEKFRILTGEKKIDLTASIPEGPVTVLGNADDLIRVFDNLLANALRYVPAQGSISISATPESKRFTIVVADTGNGILPQDLEKIWKLGWQAAGANRGAGGMGLAVVKQVVDLHHGEISVTSEGTGRGTTFTIHLPIEGAESK